MREGNLLIMFLKLGLYNTREEEKSQLDVIYR